MSTRRDIALSYFEKHNDFMETVVKENIERYRKGTAELKFTDKNENPIENIKVKVKQKNHEFKHGANIFMLKELESDEKNKSHEDTFKELFNIATVPFYWSDLEPVQGKPRYSADSPRVYRRPPIDLCLDFCRENNIEPKAHCLNYDNFTPAWVRCEGVETHKKMLDKRFRELSERYSDVIPSWEVTNETFNDKNVYKSTKFYKEDDFVEWSFRRADRYFPNNKLIINDYYVFERFFSDNRSAYYMQIERLLRNGITHLDTVGIQFHGYFPKEDEPEMAKTRFNPVYLYNVLDTYAKLGKKLQITEMSVAAYSSEKEDEELQAELIEKLYTVFFSYPSMEAIIYWNMIDGYTHVWDPKLIEGSQGNMTIGENIYYAGLMNFDLTRKKSCEVIKNLFTKKWHTETQFCTSANGEAEFRGFYGDYTLEIEYNGSVITKEISLNSDKDNSFNIVI